MSAGTLSFGQWLKQRRRDLDLTQEDLAFCVDCSISTIEKIESGERRPSKQVADLLAECLKIPADERQAFTRFARMETAQGTTTPTNTPSAEPGERAPWRVAHHRYTNLPVPLTPLIGRTEQLATIKRELAKERVRLLTLVGPPGVGKTRLGIAAAAEAMSEFDDGVFFVLLAPISDPGLVLPAMARALKVSEVGGLSPAESLKEYLRDKQALLVLDNFEHVVGAAVHLADILSYSPWLKVLVTSRQPLRVRGERQFHVPPLDVPDPEQAQEPDDLLGCSSVALFVDRALEANPDLQITEESVRSISAICSRVEGLPLAIELVAARSDGLTPGTLLQGLDGWLEIANPMQDVPDRHRTLHDAIEWSYRLLSRGEQMLFARLGVFVGGCTRSAVEAVCNPMGDLPLPVSKGLESLVAKSLLHLDSPGQEQAMPGASRYPLQPLGGPRYIMLQTIHDYAVKCLEKSEELVTVRHRHAEYYLALAQAVEPGLEGPQQAVLMALLENEHDNLRAALRWPLDSGQGNLAIQLSGSLGRFWNTRGYLFEGRRWLEEALDMAADGASPDKAKALLAAGVLASRQGDYVQAKAFYEEGLVIYSSVLDKEGMAAALSRIGAAANEQGEFERADEFYRKSLTLFQELGDEASIAGIFNNLGNQELVHGNHERAAHLFEQSLRIAQNLGSKQRASTALLNLGRVELYHRQNYDLAVSYLTESLELCRELHSKGGIAASLYQLGRAMLAQGSYSRAQSLFEKSLSLCEHLGEKPGIASTLLGLGLVALMQGGHKQARDLLNESLALCQQQGMQLGVIECIERLGGLALAEGEAVLATLLLAGSQAKREAANLPMSGDYRVLFDIWVRQSQATLGTEAFCRAWHEGSNMRVDDLISLTRRTG